MQGQLDVTKQSFLYYIGGCGLLGLISALIMTGFPYSSVKKRASLIEAHNKVNESDGRLTSLKGLESDSRVTSLMSKDIE